MCKTCVLQMSLLHRLVVDWKYSRLARLCLQARTTNGLFYRCWKIQHLGLKNSKFIFNHIIFRFFMWHMMSYKYSILSEYIEIISARKHDYSRLPNRCIVPNKHISGTYFERAALLLATPDFQTFHHPCWIC